MATIAQLNKRLDDLFKWKEEREREQFTYPLDEESKKEIHKDLIVIENRDVLFGNNVFLVSINGRKHSIIIGSTLYSFDVDTSNNLILIPKHPFVANDEVWIHTTGVAPSGINTSIPYKVVSPQENNFKLETLGGAPVNITDKGTGVHYVEKSL